MTVANKDNYNKNRFEQNCTCFTTVTWKDDAESPFDEELISALGVDWLKKKQCSRMDKVAAGLADKYISYE